MFVRVGPRLVIVLGCLLLAGGLAGWSWYGRAVPPLKDEANVASLTGKTDAEVVALLGAPDSRCLSENEELPVCQYLHAYRDAQGHFLAVTLHYDAEGRVARVYLLTRLVAGR